MKVPKGHLNKCYQSLYESEAQRKGWVRDGFGNHPHISKNQSGYNQRKTELSVGRAEQKDKEKGQVGKDHAVSGDKKGGEGVAKDENRCTGIFHVEDY